MRVALEPLVQDLRAGARIVRTSPGISLTAVALLALVIGGNTSVYSMINGLLTRPAPGLDPAGLVYVGHVGDPGNIYFSYPDYLDYAAQTRTLQSLAMSDSQRVTVSTDDGAFSATATRVTRNYFSTLGVRVIRGRTFTEAESGADAAALPVIVAARLWQERFRGDEGILGRPMLVNGYPATVVGVAPSEFRGVAMMEFAEIWVPHAAFARVPGVRTGLDKLFDRGTTAGMMLGRLAPGSSLRSAQAEFDALFGRIDKASADVEREPVVVAPYAATLGTGVNVLAPRFLALLSVVTLLTLTIVCANVANLLLARAAGRQRETAVRQSLGASRIRIVRLLMAEGLVLAVLACAAAWLLTLVVAAQLPKLMPVSAQGPMPLDFAPDWRVLIYTFALTALATIGCTLVPGIRGWRQDMLPWLKAGEHSVVQGRTRLASTLVVVQVAFSVLLLTATGLAVRSQSMMTADLGFEPAKMLLVSINTAGRAATRDEHLQLLDRIQASFANVAGVQAASYARVSRFLGARREPVRAAGAQPPLQARTFAVGADYLKTFGVSVVAGRAIAASDRSPAPPVAVINQHLADALWPGDAALGQTMEIGPQRQRVEIVGIAPNVFYSGFNSEQPDTRPYFTFVSEQPGLRAGYEGDPAAPGETQFFIAHDRQVEALAPALSAALNAIDSQLPVVQMRPFEALIDDLTHATRILATLLVYFALGSLVVAGLGQYAVSVFNMRRRTREFGVRLALGASARQVRAAVLREGALLTAAGLAIGFVLSVAAAMAARRALVGVTPTDAPTYLFVFAVLAAVSLAASYLPARRASRVDPVVALRQD